MSALYFSISEIQKICSLSTSLLFYSPSSHSLLHFCSCLSCSHYRCWRLVEEGKGHLRGKQTGRGRTARSVADTAKLILHCLITGRPQPACWLSLSLFPSLSCTHIQTDTHIKKKKSKQKSKLKHTTNTLPCIFILMGTNSLSPSLISTHTHLLVFRYVSY